MILTELPSRTPAIVDTVEDRGPQDSIARRLRELGFVNGEEVEVVAKGPLRRSEAARIRLRNGAAT